MDTGPERPANGGAPPDLYTGALTPYSTALAGFLRQVARAFRSVGVVVGSRGGPDGSGGDQSAGCRQLRRGAGRGDDDGGLRRRGDQDRAPRGRSLPEP